MRILGCALLLALAACSKGEAPTDGYDSAAAALQVATNGVVLDATQARAVAVRTVHPAASEHARVVDAFAQVVDPQPLSQLVADWTAADAAARASEGNAARTRALFEDDRNLSRQAAETAQSQALQDRARADGLLRRLASEWGGPFATDSAKALVADIAAGKASLVRIEPPAMLALSQTSSLSFRPLSGEGDVPLEPAWAAPTVTPGRIGSSWFALSQARALPAGVRGRALLASGESISGVLVPRAAVVMAHERAWAYVARGKDRYERLEVSLDMPTPDAYFVTKSFSIDDEVVVQGAGVLLAQELGVDAEEE